MIISASRRTDIPAFYSTWLVNRLRAGYVYVKNPFNPKQISQIYLNPEIVDCIVFWTKNAVPMFDKLKHIDNMGYRYYFQWTITPYGRDIEPYLPDKEKILDKFKVLSDKIGSHCMVWRYDPIIVNSHFSVDYHMQEFNKMCSLLSGYTDTCIFSYLDLYAKIKKNIEALGNKENDRETMCSIAAKFAEIARSYAISLETCAESIDLEQFGIKHASCIDKQRIERIIGYPLESRQDENQRANCRCISSIDIGAYDSCVHGCVYCYANAKIHTAMENWKKHDSCATLLLDNVCASDRITVRTMKSLKVRQGLLY